MTNAASQVETTLDRIKGERRGALIGYLPVGFPDLDTSVEAAITMARNGVDIIEFGVPYSDPVMDGPVIQAACQQALSAGFHVDQIFERFVASEPRSTCPSS